MVLGEWSFHLGVRLGAGHRPRGEELTQNDFEWETGWWSGIVGRNIDKGQKWKAESCSF